MASLRTWLGHPRAPRVALLAFVLLLLVGAALHPGHGIESTDIRTYVQMVAGVARSGLPCWSNGPIDQFPELVVPWAVPRNGQLCGVYGPLYAYVAAPAFLLGSLRAVSAMTFATLVPIVLVTARLARCFVRSPWYAVLAGFLLVVSTPLLAKSVEMSGYPLAVLASAVGTMFAVEMVTAEEPSSDRRQRLRALGCGVSWAAAVAAHAVCFPMAIVSVATIAIVARPRLSRAAALAGLALVISLLPLSLLNRIRFGSLNPLSYGPVPWRSYETNPVINQNVGAQVAFAKPILLVGVAVVVLVILLRKRPKLAGAAALAVTAASLIVPLVRERAFAYGQVLLGYVIDMTYVDFAWGYDRAPDGIGVSHFGWIVRSTLQCTPVFALAPFAGRLFRDRKDEADDRRARAVWVLLLPASALYGAMCLRANMGNLDALGLPWVYLRYTLPALPMFAVAACAVLERIRLRWWDVLFGFAIAVSSGICFLTLRELFPFKRILLVIVPLVGALGAIGAAVVTTNRRPHARLLHGLRLFVALAIGMGFGGGLGQEFRAAVLVKTGVDAWLDSFVHVVPQRFAVFGPGGLPDDLFTTTVTHDARYAVIYNNPYEDLARMRPILELWRAEGRPIFMLWETDTPPQPWPDVSFVREPTVLHLFYVRFSSP